MPIVPRPTIADLIRRPQDFKAWLTARIDEPDIGRTSEAQLCPIANWLGDETCIDDVDVDEQMIRWPDPAQPDPDEEMFIVSTPLWITRFVSIADALYPRPDAPNRFLHNQPVSSRQALWVLEQVDALEEADRNLARLYSEEESHA